MKIIQLAAVVIALASLSSTSLVAEDAQKFPKQTGVAQYPGCPTNTKTPERVDAIDFSEQLDGPTLDGARQLGIKLILRYYEWPLMGSDGKELTDDDLRQPIIGNRATKFDQDNNFKFNWREGPYWRGKALTATELKQIHEAGMLVGVVFQHANGAIRTFMDPGRPAYDANQALAQARSFNQPEQTVIFFGADHQFSKAQYKDHIEPYFKSVSAIIKGARYKLGVYGEGYICRQLKKAGHVSHCWLSQSTGSEFLESMDVASHREEWEIKQCGTRQGFSKKVRDFNPDILNANLKEIGW